MDKTNRIMFRIFIWVYFVGSIPLALLLELFFLEIKYPLDNSDLKFYAIMLVFFLLGVIAFLLYERIS